MESNAIDDLFQSLQNADGTIKETLYAGNLHQNAQEQYHVAFGVDGNFLRHACITIQSLIGQVDKGQLHCHLITSEETVGIADTLRALVTGTAHSIHVHQLPEQFFSRLPSTELFSKAIYYRLLAPYLLQDKATVLYLDADMVCLNAFTDFYNSRTSSEEIAHVVSEGEKQAPALAANIGLPPGTNYFNSGMLLINVQRWLQEKISAQVLSVLESRGHTFKYMDQDALNIVLAGHVKFVEKKYNSIFMLGHTERDYQLMPPSDTVFLHYAGADKPWQQWNKQAGTVFYTRIYANSMWASHVFDIPKNDAQAKKMYKLMLREKKYLSFLRWYLAYYKLRYSK
ncbi:glycosyl transferase [Serratia marcescens]|uniref:glycosyltransferase family 8 protein n=1 Tax=Serratia marcescens TaxID=615 RepID=UPI00188D4F8A|nr:glycosyltransferase [Serratia marcescens]MBF4654401.1 glycosyl transferase [Serratia marcescens]MBF8220484.1 glycosyl transferase [Serratia ureilytica]MBF8245958.1 glycosyl transferase [Serratia ureilytica]